MLNTRHTTSRKALASASMMVLSSLIALPAMAQDETGTGDMQLEEIVVTGTGTNISGVKSIGSPSISINRDDILATGKTSIADVVRTLPQMQDSNSFLEQPTGGDAINGQGANNTRGTTLNIRGIGSNATLLLVDGHRISPAGTATAFTEANVVPLAAIERVEVITDGASAIYGSDAIAGVVNYILRKDYEGIELNTKYTFGQYADDWSLGGVAGTHWELGDMGAGNIMFSFEHSKRDPWLRGENPRLLQDQRPYGGLDNRINGTSASPAINGNIVVSDQFPQGTMNPAMPRAGTAMYYALPMNPDGAPLSFADLRPNEANVVDRSNYEDFQPDVTRDQFTLYLNQEITPWLKAYDQFFYNKRKTVTRTFLSQNSNANVSVTVQPDSPFYIPGVPGTDATLFPGGPVIGPGPLTVQMNLLERVAPNGPRFVNDNPDKSFTNTLGFDVDLGAGWNSEIYYTYSQDKVCGTCFLGNFINGDPGNALQAQVDAGNINPFSTAAFTSDQLDSILGTNYQYSQNYTHDSVLKFDGPLFDLPGGTVKAAMGGEFYHGVQKLQNGASRGASTEVIPDANAHNVRKQYATFGELYVPVVGPDMDIPLMQEFIIDAAMRYDHYSDFGSSTNPKLSASWFVNDDLTLRGSWGTSFRAPGLPDLSAGVFSVAVQFPFYGVGADVPGYEDLFPFTNALFRLGGNSNLQPEEGETYSLGFDFQPNWLEGLNVSGTYYSIGYDNQIYGGLPFFDYLANGDNAALYAPYVTRINNPGTCDNADPSTWDPNLVPVATGFLYGAVDTPCDVQVVADGRFTNASKTKQDGLDFSANYSFGTTVGFFSLGGSVTKILHNKVQLVDGGVVDDNVDTIGNPISFRARANATYVRGVMAASIFVNHVGSYTNDLPVSDYEVNDLGQTVSVARPVSKVPGWTTFDLNLSFNFADQLRYAALSDIRLSVNVVNMFKNQPPIVHATNNSGSSIDLYAHNAFGRSIQFQLSKAF